MIRIQNLNALLPDRSKILVAVSGGQDSLCLVHLLKTLQPKHQWQLNVGHCDHQWRSDSTANANYVATIAQELEIPFNLKTAITPSSSEAQARVWRYQMLMVMATEMNANIVVTGHTLTDRAETLIFNLLRGTGLEGMQSLYWQRDLSDNIKLVRPLLEVTRSQTATYCELHQLKVWEDSTNNDLNYRRNRIRNELFPYLKEHFNPQLEIVLAQTAEILRADVDFLKEYTDRIWEENQLTDHLPRIDRGKLKPHPKALQRRLIRKFLTIHCQQQLGFNHIEKVVNLIDAPNRTQCDPLPGKVYAIVEHPWLWLRFDKMSKSGDDN